MRSWSGVVVVALMSLLGGCPGDTDTSFPPLPGIYDVVTTTDPDPATALEPATVRYTIYRDGEPVQDLQIAHERLVHVFVIRGDLATFEHKHHEDYADVTADDLRAATFHFPQTFSASGPFVLAYEFASENAYHLDRADLVIAGDVAQLDAPDLTPTATSTDGSVTGTFSWDATPAAGQESAFTITLADDNGPVTDVVPWLGADAHAAVVSADLVQIGHAHAYVPGMENAPPSHAMPHVYDGPDIAFRYTFPGPGTYKVWVQFARSEAPDAPHTLPFVVEIP